MHDLPLPSARLSWNDMPPVGLRGLVPDSEAASGPGCEDLIGFDAEAGITFQPARARPSGVQAPSDLASLMARIRLGEEAALAALHAACAARLLASALRIVRRPELAQEAVSSAFMQVWHQAQGFDADRANVLTWLNVIVRSRAIDLSRQTTTRSRHECALSETELCEFADVAPEPSRRVEQSQARVGLRRALAALAPIQRQVLSLTFLEGHSQEEAAAHLGIPLGTVKSHARRGLAALRAHATLRAAHASA